MKKIIITGFGLLMTLASLAQYQPQKQLYFNHLTIEDGLPEGTVTALLQDKEGYIWIGTQKGIVRYDGYNPKTYMLGVSTPSVLIITEIYQDQTGRLWVGTQNLGLYLYDRPHDRFIHYQIDSASSVSAATNSATESITDILGDNQGNIWAIPSTWMSPLKQTHTILYRLNPLTKKFTCFGKDETRKYYINASLFYKLFRDKDGHIWVSTDNGLFEYNHQSGMFMLHTISSDHSVKAGYGQIYHDPVHPDIVWMANARLNLVYEPIVVAGKGLCRFDTKDDSVRIFLHSPGNPNSLASDTVFAVKRDREGDLWVATAEGISLFNSQKNNFINYQPDDGESVSVRELAEDSLGNLWCASPDGLLFFNTQTRKFIRYVTNLNGHDIHLSNTVHQLLVGRHGTLWFGMIQSGLRWINVKRSRFMLYSDNSEQSYFFTGGGANSIAESKGGDFWVGTRRGLYYWQPRIGSFKEIKINGKSVPVQVVITDHKGYVWLGNMAGLYRYDPLTGRAKHFQYNRKDTTSLSNNQVDALLEDHLGHIWVGTFGGGLCRFNRQSQNFIRYPFETKKHASAPNQKGTDNNQITALYEDKEGTLWIGCNAYGSLDSLNRRTGTFTSYAGKAPGFSALMTIYEDKKGRLWAGTFIGGVFCLTKKRDSVIRYNEKDGLLYDRVSGILEDDKGNLWLSSPKGISILNPQTK